MFKNASIIALAFSGSLTLWGCSDEDSAQKDLIDAMNTATKGYGEAKGDEDKCWIKIWRTKFSGVIPPNGRNRFYWKWKKSHSKIKIKIISQIRFKFFLAGQNLDFEFINYSGQKVTEDYKKQCSELKDKYKDNAEVKKVHFNWNFLTKTKFCTKFEILALGGEFYGLGLRIRFWEPESKV